MNFSKIKNGIRITVLKWSNIITLTDAETGAFIKAANFQDHVTAVRLARSLAK